MIHLVTGYAGYEHIQSEDTGAYNASFFGNGQYVMEDGNQLEGSILNNNTVRILDGNGLMYGRHFRIPRNTYEDVIISTGTAGKNRIDLICMTYAKNENDGTETAYLQVIKGAESDGQAVVPTYTDGNILEGAVLNQMPLYKVVIEGVVLKEIMPLFVTIPTYKTLVEQYAAEFQAKCESHLDSLNVLDTMEEVDANTQENQLAGALAVKEGFAAINDSLTSMFTVVALSSDSVSVGANSYGSYAFKNVAPDGYEIFAIKSYFVNAGRPHIYGITITDNQITVSLWNNSANTSTTNIGINVICIKKM